MTLYDQVEQALQDIVPPELFAIREIKRLDGRIDALDEKLGGQMRSLDEKIGTKIDSLLLAEVKRVDASIESLAAGGQGLVRDSRAPLGLGGAGRHIGTRKVKIAAQAGDDVLAPKKGTLTPPCGIARIWLHRVGPGGEIGVRGFWQWQRLNP